MTPTLRPRTPRVPSASVAKQPDTKAVRRAKANPAAKAKAAPRKAKSSAKKETASRKAAAGMAAPIQAASASKMESSAVLDHQAYPHIFESMIQYAFDDAPYGFLLSLRTLSHSIRDTIDHRLASHLVLRRGLPPPSGAKWNKLRRSMPLGPRQRLPPRLRANIASKYGQLPGLVCDYNHVWRGTDSCGDDCTLRRKRWEAIFATTAVLDHHPWDYAPSLRHLQTHFPALKVARKYPCYGGSLDLLAETLIVFTTLAPTKSEGFYHVTSAPVVLLTDDERVRKMVIHTTFDCLRPTLPSCWVQLLHLGNVEDVVMIFEPVKGTEVYINPGWKLAPTPHVGFLWDVFTMLACARFPGGPKARFVVVGALELPSRLLGIGDDDERGAEELEAVLIDRALERIRGISTARQGGLMPDREEIRDCLKFVSVEQYRRQVGEAQWALESVRTKSW